MVCGGVETKTIHAGFKMLYHSTFQGVWVCVGGGLHLTSLNSQWKTYKFDGVLAKNACATKWYGKLKVPWNDQCANFPASFSQTTLLL